MVVYNVSMLIDQVEIHAKSCKCGYGNVYFCSEKSALQGGADGGDVIVEVKFTLCKFDLEGQA